MKDGISIAVATLIALAAARTPAPGSLYFDASFTLGDAATLYEELDGDMYYDSLWVNGNGWVSGTVDVDLLDGRREVTSRCRGIIPGAWASLVTCACRSYRWSPCCSSPRPPPRPTTVRCGSGR